MAVLYEKDGRITIITINRPEALNSFDPDTLKEFSDALIDFRDDEEAWVGIITAAGEKAFSAGADLKTTIPMMTRKGGGDPWRPPATVMRGLQVWKPLIAAVNGMALGGGMEVALACDIRIAAEKASFGQPEVKWSIIPGWGGTQRLSRAIPLGKAMEIILMGRTIDAPEAYRLGLVNAVVPAAELLSTAKKWAEEICQLGPLGVRAAKEAMIRGLEMSLEAGLRLEQVLFDGLRFTEDAEEGPRAFAERRKPEFKGR
ncbi:MAG: enoyl-CoA hydratase/isomerase family protein [Chloroflexi bacterium]|nr:enoyl-CoA hydratase/isomerase family protein [Chloroflexota bacterium]